MYEFINLTSFCGLIIGAVVLRKPQYRALWVFVLVPVLILLTVSGKWLYANAAPVMPALEILLAADPRLGGQPRVRGVPGLRGGQHPVPAQALEVRRTVSRRSLARAWCPRLPDAQTLDRIATAPPFFHRVPGVRFRRDLRCDLGRGGVGPLLGLGPQGDGVLHHLGDLRDLPTPRSTAGWRIKKAAWINDRRLRGDGLQPVLHQPGDRRPALLQPASLIFRRKSGSSSGPMTRVVEPMGLPRDGPQAGLVSTAIMTMSEQVKLLEPPGTMSRVGDSAP